MYFYNYTALNKSDFSGSIKKCKKNKFNFTQLGESLPSYFERQPVMQQHKEGFHSQ